MILADGLSLQADVLLKSIGLAYGDVSRLCVTPCYR